MGKPLNSFPSELRNRFDVAIIGGGVVGCAVARRFTLEGAKVILLEKARDILAGASKGNRALLHGSDNSRKPPLPVIQAMRFV